MRDITGIIRRIQGVIATHDLGSGTYARWLWQDAEGRRELGGNPYGCADAVNLLYTIGEFPQGAQRQGFIKNLQAMQNPQSGLFVERTHHAIHTTAHCIAALELLDARPLYPLRDLHPHLTLEGLQALLEGLDWLGDPWSQSHCGAGIYAAAVIAGEASAQWQAAYFDWLHREADPETGLWRKGFVMAQGAAPIYHHMAGSFHYLFNHEHAAMPLVYPDKMIDSCIDMCTAPQNAEVFCQGCSFIDIDLVYCLNRASRQTPHRFDEVKALLADYARRYVDMLEALDWATDEAANDLHQLFGAVCCLAELQRALPGTLLSPRPLKLVLDRRPFI